MVWLWVSVTTGHVARTGNRPWPREAPRLGPGRAGQFPKLRSDSS